VSGNAEPRPSVKRLLLVVFYAVPILAVLAYGRFLATGELHDKYVYSDMGTLVANKAPMARFVPFTSVSGYLLYALPTRTRGNAIVGDPNEFVQLIALDTLCSDEVCLLDPDKQINVSCSQVEAVLRDPRVVAPAKDYLRSRCTRPPNRPAPFQAQ
jgi:hypothetical protein